MNEAKIMSTFCSTPNNKSDLSFSEMAGKSTGRPGRLTPFLLPKEPPFSISHSTELSANLILNCHKIYVDKKIIRIK